jgi:krueppel-like factor 5
MHKLNKLDTNVELELQRSAINSINNNSSMGYQCDSYAPSKDFHYDIKKNHDSVDDAFMRPPLWEDITSSIQNIDPENAIMLNALTNGATQVKLESCDETTFLESLSSPLLSPLEIKTEKDFYQQQNCHQSQLPSHNMTNGTDYHQQYHHQQINGYQDFNIHQQLPGQQQYSNNYYNNWQQPPHHPQQPQSHQTNIYTNNNNNNKYSQSQSSNFSAPISRLMYVPPLTPPTSDPGSPGNNIQVSEFFIIVIFY